MSTAISTALTRLPNGHRAGGEVTGFRVPASANAPSASPRVPETPTTGNGRTAGTARRHVPTVRAFFRLLEVKNIRAWIGLWADDGEQYYPFGTKMFPPHLAGKAAIYDRWRRLPTMFDTLRFPIREIWTDRDTIIARFDGACAPKGGGKIYRNSYIAIFKFDEHGKIKEYWEYFDPITAGVDFGFATVDYLTS